MESNILGLPTVMRHFGIDGNHIQSQGMEIIKIWYNCLKIMDLIMHKTFNSQYLRSEVESRMMKKSQEEKLIGNEYWEQGNTGTTRTKAFGACPFSTWQSLLSSDFLKNRLKAVTGFKNGVDYGNQSVL